MAKKNAPVSQSRTMWVKKGEIVNGKKVEKGYLAQLGKPEKRVTAQVKIETATKSGKKAGEVYRYKAGRTVKPADKVKGGNGPGGGGTGGGTGRGGGGGGNIGGGRAMSSATANRIRSVKQSERGGPVAGSIQQKQAKQNIRMTPERNPASLVGGSVAIANMSKKQARWLLNEWSKGNRRISAVNRRLLEQYVQGTR